MQGAKVVWAVPEVSQGRGGIGVPVVHRTAFCRVGFPTQRSFKLLWTAKGLGPILWWPEERQGTFEVFSIYRCLWFCIRTLNG